MNTKNNLLTVFFTLFFSFPIFADQKLALSQPKVVSGDTVYSILKRHGFNDNQRKDAVSQASLPSEFVLSPGEIFRVIRNVNGVLEVVFYSKTTPQSYTFWRGRNGQFGGKTENVNFEVQTLTAAGRIHGSIVESIAAAVGDERLAFRFMDAFLLDYNLVKEVQRNAPFRLIYEKLYDKGLFVRFGEVRLAEIEIDGALVTRKYRELKSGGGIFFEQGIALGNRKFYAPVENIKISSLFQNHRFHPIRKFRRAHTGVDFEIANGSPVYSAANGVVLRTGRNRAAGRFIVVRHEGGYESYYNHMSEVRPLVIGQSVLAGTALGRVGCSGYCTKPHLHFAIKKNGAFINPIYLIRNYAFFQRQEVMNLIAKNGSI